MPVVLAPSNVARWLVPDRAPEVLHHLLHPCAEDALEVWPVDQRVGSVKHDGPELIVRAA